MRRNATAAQANGQPLSLAESRAAPSWASSSALVVGRNTGQLMRFSSALLPPWARKTARVTEYYRFMPDRRSSGHFVPDAATCPAWIYRCMLPVRALKGRLGYAMTRPQFGRHGLLAGGSMASPPTVAGCRGRT